MVEYEDTVTPESAPCTDCGVMVDEDLINTEEWNVVGDWVCPDCGETRLEHRMEREAGFYGA